MLGRLKEQQRPVEWEESEVWEELETGVREIAGLDPLGLPAKGFGFYPSEMGRFAGLEQSNNICDLHCKSLWLLY